jgi:hypothetical protein
MNGKELRDLVARAEQKIHVLYTVPSATDEDVRHVLEDLVVAGCQDRADTPNELVLDKVTFDQFVDDVMLGLGRDIPATRKRVLRAIIAQAESALKE